MNTIAVVTIIGFILLTCALFFRMAQVKKKLDFWRDQNAWTEQRNKGLEDKIKALIRESAQAQTRLEHIIEDINGIVWQAERAIQQTQQEKQELEALWQNGAKNGAYATEILRLGYLRGQWIEAGAMLEKLKEWAEQ